MLFRSPGACCSLPTVLTIFQGKMTDSFIGLQPDNVVADYVERAAALHTPVPDAAGDA